MRLERAATAIVALLLAAGAHAALYKWVDEKGRVQYSDKPPSEKDKGGVQMTNRGIVVKKLESGMSPEQKKARDEEETRRKQEDSKAAEQRRQDNALLMSFTSAQEIDMKRDREVQALETIIGNLREQERASAERIADDRRRMEVYAKRQKGIPDAVKEDLARNEAQSKLIREEIERRYQEVLTTRSKYELLKKRYQDLREQEQVGSAPPASAAVPAPKK